MITRSSLLGAAVLFAAASIGAGPLIGQVLPPDEDSAGARLDTSPRHGEWVDYDAGDGDQVRAWVTYPERSDAVVYYGSSPDDRYEEITAPVLGLYGGADNRVNATIPLAQEAMDRLGRSYAANVFEGAGHGFLRNQPGQEGANMTATQQAWRLTVAFFREQLGS